MPLTPHHLHKTKLTDRTLWFDGDSTYNADDLLRLMQKYDVKYVDTINDTVEQYNRHTSNEQELRVKEEVSALSFVWNIPDEYKVLNVRDYVFDKLVETAKETNENEFGDRALRVINELSAYENRGLFDVLRATIYVINTLTETNSVWGVGRGSSVSSYVLYLIGVHDVDSYAYQLDIDDFLHD